MKGQRSERVGRAPLGLDRRTLLIGGGIGVGMVVGWGAWRWGSRDDPRTERSFGAYLKIGLDGRVIVAVPQVETGQGIWTALPQLVADELGAAWDMVGVEPAPFDGAYANPFADEQGWFGGLGVLRRFRLDDGAARITARSTSVRAFEQPMREAGAVARAMLIEAAADRWNVDPSDCDARDGKIVSGGRSLGFGEVAEEAAGRSAGAPVLRTGPRPLAGRPLPRLDLPAKAKGAFRFAADVRLPGMLFASARLTPPDGRLAGFAQGKGIVAGDGWVAAVGETGWAAETALKAANVRFETPRPLLSLDASFDDALAAGQAETWFERGDYQQAVEGSRALTALYRVSPTMHLGLEPLTATARVNGDGVEVWAASQAPELSRRNASDGAGGGAVTFYPLPPGDQSGRAMESGPVAIAIALARKVGRPVQVTIPASASQNHDRPSPGALARMYGLPGPGGITAAWKMRLVTASGLRSAIARMADGSSGRDLLLPEGTDAAPPYGIPNVRIDAVPVRLPFDHGYMRGSPERELTFFNESFADELARAAGIDPLSFRMALLGSSPRLANCLQRVTSAGGWDGGGPGSMMGIAACSAYGSHIALLAEATIGSDQSIEVHRLVASVDCGRVVNSGLVEQQIAGGLIWALGQATVAAPEWSGGIPLSRGFGQLKLPRLAKVPEIRVDLVPADAPPGGVNGLGVAVLAPAIANAIHAATGKRLRTLPFDPMAAP